MAFKKKTSKVSRIKSDESKSKLIKSITILQNPENKDKKEYAVFCISVNEELEVQLDRISAWSTRFETVSRIVKDKVFELLVLPMTKGQI